MKHWITSDQHWGHENIIRLGERPFSSLDEMNEALLSNWNEVVQPEDIVYHLGDIFWNRYMAKKYMPLLNGKIILLPGNHDKRWVRYYREMLDGIRTSILLAPLILTIDAPIHATFCHYPMVDWEGKFRDAWHFHGHVHQNIKSEGKRINVCVEETGYTPILLEEFVDRT